MIDGRAGLFDLLSEVCSMCTWILMQAILTTWCNMLGKSLESAQIPFRAFISGRQAAVPPELASYVPHSQCDCLFDGIC